MYFFLSRHALLVKGKGKPTVAEQAELEEKRNTLRWRITTFVELRNFYMPALGEFSTDGLHAASHDKPEMTPLRLPSSLSANSWPIICSSTLIDTEHRIHLAQADVALYKLQRLLRVTSGLWQYKVHQVGHSQKASTRAYTLISCFKDKTTCCANRYHQAYSTLVSLDPHGDWKAWLQPLNDEDIKGLGKDHDEAEGTRQLSWIWLVQQTGDTASAQEGDITDSL
jgi:hypothetical protein